MTSERVPNGFCTSPPLQLQRTGRHCFSTTSQMQTAALFTDFKLDLRKPKMGCIWSSRYVGKDRTLCKILSKWIYIWYIAVWVNRRGGEVSQDEPET